MIGAVSQVAIRSPDVIVVGGGIGGLAAGALLAAAGEQVLLLEAHTTTGGCAGYFDRHERSAAGERIRFRFDVGATTLSALEPGQPLRRLLEGARIDLPLRRIDPGMAIHLPAGPPLLRWSDRDRWIAACIERFGEQGQRRFWDHIARIAARGWELSRACPTFPPKSLGDLLHLLHPANLTALPLLRATRISVLNELRRCGLEEDLRFRAMVDELLMITAQNRAEHTPLLVGALGLDYPSDTWYADGGMHSLARRLEERIAEQGRILTKRRVTEIRREGSGWEVTTARGERFRAPRVVANVMLHDLVDLIPEGRRHFGELATRAGAGWGALTLYGAVEECFDDCGTLYHQIHAEGIPYASSGALFVSFSHRGDRLRAPEGWRTMTVSTHVAAPEEWEHLGEAEYADRKEVIERELLRIIASALPGFAHARKKFLLVGTPRTFRFYTGRHHGMVGGVPHSIERSMLFDPTWRTPFGGLYLVGDTLYPGQGTPAVVLGALNLVEGIA